MNSDLLFEVATPVGFVVRCSRAYWEFIVTHKHPVLKGHDQEVAQVLADPDEVRQSRKDFYRGASPRWLCAVTRREDGSGFLITVYPDGQSQDGGDYMDKIKIVHDVVGHTLTVWLDDPAKEQVCEETSDEVILMKDASGRVVGFELLHYRPTGTEQGLAVETVVKTGP